MSFQFFSSSQNGTTAPLGSQDKPKARSEEKQTVLPVTIRAIETAVQQEGDELLFYGSPQETLVLVASIETCTKLPTSLDLVVNDGTGRIRVRQFLSGDADSQHEGIQPGRYVHMFGGVRRKPELHFAAQGVRPVATADEVSYHMIEVAHSALRLQRGARAAAPMMETPVKNQAAQDSEMTPPKAPEPAAQAPEPAAQAPEPAAQAATAATPATPAAKRPRASRKAASSDTGRGGRKGAQQESRFVISNKNKVAVLQDCNLEAAIVRHLAPGTEFAVAETKVDKKDGRSYLRLSDGTGWVPTHSRKDPEKVVVQEVPAPEAADAAAPAAAGSLSGRALREAIAKFLEGEAESKGEEGCSKSEVIAHFKTSSDVEVVALLSDLVSEGDAMTTIDDDHFSAV